METFFVQKDMDALLGLLTPDCTFEGPLYSFDSAIEYVNAMKNDPPEAFEYEEIDTFERGSHACVVFRFSKPGVDIPMVQIFDTREGRISSILLIFDSAPFVRH